MSGEQPKATASSSARNALLQLTGMEQLKLISTESPSGIGKLMGIRLVEFEDGRVVLESEPSEAVNNPLGVVHGGYAATLLDSACGIATHTKLSPGQSYSTLELKISYIRGMTAGTGPVRVEGKIVNYGRRVVFAEASVTDLAGRLLASGTSTLLLVNA